MRIIHHLVSEFSSPTGVLYFKIAMWFGLQGGLEKFSSPTGVLYFKIDDVKVVDLNEVVFVPYWGSLFQNSGIN